MSEHRPLIVLALVLAAGCAPRAAPSPDPLGDYLDSRQRETGFSGAVLIARGGEVLLRTARGSADLEHGLALIPEHVFRIGSVTKTLTATAALTLVEHGRLALDASICSFVASCPEPWQPVTVRHLLSHTSGIPDLFGELPSAPVEETRAEVDRLIARLETPSLVAEPGLQYAYSNFNYVLLGYAIEVASGQLWEAYLHDSLFAPLGMERTGYDDVWAAVRRVPDTS